MVNDTEYRYDVFRVQDAEGRGPFRPGFTKHWLDAAATPERLNLKSCFDEFGHDLLIKRGRYGDHYGAAVVELKDLGKWFTEGELKYLNKFHNYNVVQLGRARILAESVNQVVFGRRLPLARKAILLPIEKVHE